MAIYFYIPSDKYGIFSNFSSHGIDMDGEWWPTAEHYFQAMKFHDVKHRERIRRAADPGKAKNLGRDTSIPLRGDWEEVKDEIMYNAVKKKFAIHRNIRKMLLETGDQELVENAANDYYWGCGADGSGKNKLGKILMRVRNELRNP